MKNICGQCQKEFETEKGYLDHVCEVSAVTPKDPKHSMGANYEEISKAALERGSKRLELEQSGKTPEEAIAETRDIGKIAK